MLNSQANYNLYFIVHHTETNYRNIFSFYDSPNKVLSLIRANFTVEIYTLFTALEITNYHLKIIYLFFDCQNSSFICASLP